jgi:hypothetical protein
MTKITQTLVAALVLATASVAVNTSVYAKPAKAEAPASQELSWMDRASQTVDGGGY